MSLTHQEFSQLLNEKMVEIVEEHECSTEAAIGGVALSALILMEGADASSIEIGNFTLSITETQPTTK
ncbi:hypothetical protein VPHK389_0076 [Vibrio phage K389]|nr:hypothetical protein SIPHO010v1_p0026 [Vibrio phage 268E42.1]